MKQIIEVQERLETQSFKNLPQELQRFLITAKGKYMQLNPNCPHCESINVVQNGYYECESKLIKSLGLSIKHGHCLCNTCGKTFSTKYPELEKFLNDLHRFLAENCFRLFVRGLSFGAIAEYIKEHFGMSITDETARQYYKEIVLEYKDEKSLQTSGFFCVDCQHMKVNGEKSYRLSIIDAKTKACIADVVIDAENNMQIINRLRLHLLPYKIKGFIVDGKLGLVVDIKKEFNVPVQRCIFHIQQLIVKDYIKKYGKALSLLQLRNMYMLLSIFADHDSEIQFLNRKIDEKVIKQDEKKGLEEFYEFRKSLKKYRRKEERYLIPRNEQEMKEKLAKAKLFITEKHEKSRIEKIEKEWEYITQFLHVEGLPATNNNVEHYYSKTLTKTEKKRFRGIEALKEKITACKIVYNKWFKPTISLQDILQKHAKLFLYFSA